CNCAGGFWLPYSVFDPDRDTPEFHRQYLQAVKFSYFYFQQLPTYVITDDAFTDTETLGSKGPFPEVFPEMRDLQPSEHRFPYRYVRQFRAMLIERLSLTLIYERYSETCG